MSRRLVTQLLVTTVAGLMSWFALWSWKGLIEQPHRILGPAFVGMVLVVVVGVLGRWKLRHWYLVLPLQLVVVVFWLQHQLAGGGWLSGWAPTPAALHHGFDVIVHGAREVDRYASPVGVEHSDAAGYLTAAAVLVILAVDLIGCGLRRAPWAGLPVVVAMTVPISVLDTGLSSFVFVVTALLYVLLLATDELDRVGAWAQLPDRHRYDAGPADGTTTVRSAAVRIGMVTAVGALVLPVLVPVTNGLLDGGRGRGNGAGRNNSVQLDNPLVDLHRDLVRQDHIALLFASTHDPDPTYLRLTVLDEFDGRAWKPSQRNLPAANRVGGDLPRPPGLAPNTSTSAYPWSLHLTPDFVTSWLPAPYPLKSLDTLGSGDWRFDSRTLDFADVDNQTPTGFSYSLTSLHVQIDPTALQQAPGPPSSIKDAMTALPKFLPPVVADTARRVTASGTTQFDKAVLLQDWFRRTGGFVYSLAPDTGSASDALVRFITTDKVGFCEQFAAAMAIMARSLGIPARVVVGLIAPEQYAGGEYTYTSDALHAWPEIYFSGVGWVRFEPTPSVRTGRAPAWTRQPTSILPSSTPTPTATPSTQAPSTTKHQKPPPQTSSTPRGNSGVRAAWSVAIVLVLLLLLVPGLIRRRQRHHRLRPPARTGSDAVALGLWTELLATADDLGIVLPESRSVRQVAEAIAHRVGSADTFDLERLVTFIERARYGRGFEVDPETLEDMGAVVLSWSHALGEAVSPGRRLGARIAPRSIVVRRTPILFEAEHAVPQPVGAGEVG